MDFGDLGGGLSGLSGLSALIAIGGPATHFAVHAPSVVVEGASFDFTVVALDAQGNMASSYPGTITFTSTDGSATLPSDSPLPHNMGVFTATLQVTGTITASDVATPSITGTSAMITEVNATGVSKGAAYFIPGVYTSGRPYLGV